jgi:hypothetical protein
MGMELTSNWTCDRCARLKQVRLGDIPAGWKCLITPAAIAVDPETYSPDMKMGFKKCIVCEHCVAQYEEWRTGPLKAQEATDPEPEEVEPTESVPAAPEMTRAVDVGQAQPLSEDAIAELEKDIQ